MSSEDTKHTDPRLDALRLMTEAKYSQDQVRIVCRELGKVLVDPSAKQVLQEFEARIGRDFPTSLNHLRHDVVAEALSLGDEKTSLELPQIDSNKKTKKKRHGNNAWSDTELHAYWMKVLKGAFQLITRRYVHALKIAQLLWESDQSEGDSREQVIRRAQLVQALTTIPAPGNVIRRRTALFHANAEDFRKDAMERLKLTSIRVDPDFDEHYTSVLFPAAMKLSKEADKEINWLRKSVQLPSFDIMF